MLKNRYILNSIRSVQGIEYQNVIPVAESLTGSELAMAILDDYPTAKNAFINALTNRIGRDMFFNKVF